MNDHTDGELIGRSLFQWANHIQTGDITMTPTDVANSGIGLVKALSDEQQVFVNRLCKLADDFMSGRSIPLKRSTYSPDINLDRVEGVGGVGVGPNPVKGLKMSVYPVYAPGGEPKKLHRCCKVYPNYFTDGFGVSKTYWLKCPGCGRRTQEFRSKSKAIECWNSGKAE